MSNWRDTAPDWFRAAVESPWEQRFVESGGAKVHYRLRGAAGAPGIVLCHGNAAHSGWWDFIAPAIAETHRVAAMDFAGMGDSEERRNATPEGFAQDIASVIADAGFEEPPLLIGHSFGGGMSMFLAETRPELIRGLVMMDSPIYPPPEIAGARPAPPKIAPRRYPKREIALERFRLIPEQPVVNEWAVNYIADTGIMETPRGWIWKARTNIFGHPAFGESYWQDQRDRFPRVTVPLHVVWGTLSALCTPDTMAYMRSVAPAGTSFVEMPDAYHHVLLDQPEETIRIIREIAAA